MTIILLLSFRLAQRTRHGEDMHGENMSIAHGQEMSCLQRKLVGSLHATDTSQKLSQSTRRLRSLEAHMICHMPIAYFSDIPLYIIPMTYYTYNIECPTRCLSDDYSRRNYRTDLACCWCLSWFHSDWNMRYKRFRLPTRIGCMNTNGPIQCRSCTNVIAHKPLL